MDHLNEILKFISVREVGRHLLKIDSVFLDNLDRDYKISDEKREKLVYEWRKRNASEATYYAMIAAMVKAQYIEDAERVCKLCPQKGNSILTQ